MSKEGLELLAKWEGCVLKVYKDAAGYPTVGIGHLLTSQEKASGVLNINGEAVHYGAGITKEQALDLLAQDVKPAEDAVNARVKTLLTQNQFDALVSFTFNCGAGAFASSTLLKAINAGYLDQVPKELAKWTKAGGKTCNGLITRRANETKLWLCG